MAAGSIIGDVEEALIARVKAAFPVVNGRQVLRAVEALPGDWDDSTLKRLLRAVPGVFVAFGGGPAKYRASTAVTIDATWVAYVITAHASGEAARRLGDGQQIGAYQIVQSLVAALEGWGAALEGAGALEVSAVENLYTGTVDSQGVAVYSVTAKQELTLGAGLVAPDLGRFAIFDALIDLPAHDSAQDHADWLAGDLRTSRPEAEVRVELPPILD